MDISGSKVEKCGPLNQRPYESTSSVVALNCFASSDTSVNNENFIGGAASIEFCQEKEC